MFHVELRRVTLYENGICGVLIYLHQQRGIEEARERGVNRAKRASNGGTLKAANAIP
jgi:hypothetical protein